VNKLCITLLLIFAVWFGWQRYAEHRARIERDQARIEREAHARNDGYDRCTAPVDEAYFLSHGDEQVWRKARQGCLEFWVTGPPKPAGPK